jgi:hypothetical protein
MGEIAEMHLNGTLCERCGEFLGDPIGYPQYCASCGDKSDLSSEIEVVKVWIGNIPYAWATDNLHTFLDNHLPADVQIYDLDIIKKKQKDKMVSAGRAYLLVDHDDLDAVLALHNTKVEGRPIKVKEWVE